MYKDFEDLNSYFYEKVLDFGGIINSNYKKRDTVSGIRENSDWGNKFFGCIDFKEADSGEYSDLSLIVFPSNEEKIKDRWLVTLAVGTGGYDSDLEAVSIPGTRRNFCKYLESSELVFIKHDYTDLESKEGVSKLWKNIPTLKKTCDIYSKLILAAQLIDPNNPESSRDVIDIFLALYAKIREWDTNDNRRKKIREVLSKAITKKNDETGNISKNEKETLNKLLKTRKYVVLQGAPGTGKTRLAKLVTEENGGDVFFTQFHAETSYSDFIYKIVPDVNNDSLRYIAADGIFVEAVKRALELEKMETKCNASSKNVYLIIDEINSASLSNVLGQIFYLFEPDSQENSTMINITPTFKISKLPNNFYVIATMNTADRSLAVVDFALRRRFAWMEILPRELDEEEVEELNKNGKEFCDEEFNAISEIFEKYADDNELTLQPGQSYFIIEKGNGNIKDRLKYELMPLIKEYLMSGLLMNARNDFINYFRRAINEEMFK